MLLDNLKDAEKVLADKAYDADKEFRNKLKDHNCEVIVPPRSNRKNIEEYEYDKHTYKSRHLIENLFCKLKQYRAIATRYDKTDRNFLAAIHLVASIILLA